MLNDKNRTIALTLLRAVGWLSRNDLNTRRGHAGPEIATPGAQCLEPQIAHYSIIPHDKSETDQFALRQVNQFITPLKAIQLEAKTDSELPSSRSFLSIHSTNYNFSCLKKAEDSDSTILRIFEPNGQSVKVNLHTAFPIKDASLVNLAERHQNSLSVKPTSPSTLIIPLAPYQIQTLQFRLH